MGKRNKKKLRKIMHAQAEHQVSTSTSMPEGQEEVIASDAKAEIKPQTQMRNDSDAAETHEVKKEIRKILITYSILILAVVAVYLINTKSDIILKAGVWMVDRLNLSI